MGYFNDDSEIRSEMAWKEAKVFWLIYCLGAYIFYAFLITCISGFKHTGTGDFILFMLIPFFMAPQSVFVAAFFYIFRIETYALGSKIEALLLGIVECWLSIYPPDFLNVLDDISLIAPLCITIVILLLQGLIVRLYKRYKHEPYCTEEDLEETEALEEDGDASNTKLNTFKIYLKSTGRKLSRFYLYYSLAFCTVTFISSAIDLTGAIAGCIMALTFFSTQATITCACFYVLRIETYALGSKIEALALGLVEGYIMMFGYGFGFLNSIFEKAVGDMSFFFSPTLLTALILLPQGIIIWAYRLWRVKFKSIHESEEKI